MKPEDHQAPATGARQQTTDLAALTEKAGLLRRRFGENTRDKDGREWTREEVMQGFVVDVGDLMKLVMAKSGLRDESDLDRKLAHELADCLWSVLVLAKLYDVDLEKEYLSMLTTVSAKLAAATRKTARVAGAT